MTTKPSFEDILISVDGAVGRLVLNRPAKLNPLRPATLEEIVVAARWFDANEDIRVVVVRGEGRAFSAGADLGGFKGVDVRRRRDNADLGRKMADALEAMRPLAIASIHGWCVGGALVLAAACDLRIAAESARFAIPEVDLGIGLAWGGIPRLVREIGPALTKELVLTCREFDPAEAKAAGFLNRVVPDASLDAEVDALAATLAAKAAYPLGITKRHVNSVTQQALGTHRTWSDADAVLTAYLDPECNQVREHYLASRLSRSGE